jgi:hypothetical protein
MQRLIDPFHPDFLCKTNTLENMFVKICILRAPSLKRVFGDLSSRLILPGFSGVLGRLILSFFALSKRLSVLE